MRDEPLDEQTYDSRRMAQWLAGDTLIRKPLPAEHFIEHGENAEMRWSALRDQGHLVPTERFFVRNHTSTPHIDVTSWRLRLFGAGLAGAPTIDNPVELSYAELRGFPRVTLTATVECAGNGRSLFADQQGQPTPGTPWRLGAVGVARWGGVRLADVLRHAGLTDRAVDLMPQGLDDHWISEGIDYGPVRRPLPIAKALHDVLLVDEMNGEPLPPDHGYPVRLIVPDWVGVASIKWLGQIEVADTALFSPWNTEFYRLFGPGRADGGDRLESQVVKSAFELDWPARLPAGERIVLRGRSWSANGRIRQVRVSTDGGASWREARLTGPDLPHAWRCWELDWQPATAGAYELLARATDATGAGQPDVTPYNEMGYLFDAVARHPVTVG